MINGQYRANMEIGDEVDIILKKDQRTGERTRGYIKDFLTKVPRHHRGIKVRLEDGQIGRVIEVYKPDQSV